jgi:ubiquinone/menaquinone biosynthesis C-methylase UbiE
MTNNSEVKMYFCPDCKVALQDLHCPSCKVQFDCANEFPVLFSRDPRFQAATSIGTVYDDIYTNRAGVWEDQGRTPEFVAFFSDLLGKLSGGRLLEVGCGEGFLLSSIRSSDKFAIDLSIQALRKASARTQATFCAALAERLPFAEEFFDMVTSVGVMEHFLDDREATKEIRRVLTTGGRYVVLIHVDLSVKERISQKIREYVYPRMRPMAFSKWISTKFIRPIAQPIQRLYTRQTVEACLRDSGFTVEEVISSSTHSDAPLIGPHVLIFVARKS